MSPYYLRIVPLHYAAFRCAAFRFVAYYGVPFHPATQRNDFIRDISRRGVTSRIVMLRPVPFHAAAYRSIPSHAVTQRNVFI
jgi:hypothetical protein